MSPPPPERDCSVVIITLSTGRDLIRGASEIARGTTMQLEQETSIPPHTPSENP